MTTTTSPPLSDASEEVTALIATLHETGQRLEELTAGEVDAVADRHGRTFLLRRAQDRLRESEMAKQAAILNALPAHIALLDGQGIIVSVNETWRRLVCTNAIQGPGHSIGVDYLDICDSAGGVDSSDARQVAEGIRSILAGRLESFSIEYPCHLPTEKRWFLMTVTPLMYDHVNGAVVMHVDTTQRRLIQVALAESEAGLHRAQLMAKLGHVVSGSDGSFESWSETLPQLIGVVPRELPRTVRAWLAIVHPEDRSLFLEKAVEANINQRRTEVEYRVRRNDGQWISIRQTMEPLEGDAAGGSRWFNTLQDLTAERLSNESLRASELRFRQMAENIDDVFFLQSLDSSQMHYVSPAYEHIWGRTCESLYSNPVSWADSIHPDDVAHALEQLRESSNTGFDYECRIIRPDGGIRWIHARGFPIRDDAGNPYRTAGVCSDITQRKHAAQELRESERRFSDILQNVELASVMVDREARITYCNDYLLRLTGWRYEEVFGRNWFDVFIPDEIHNHLKEFFAGLLADAPDARHHENEILTRSGERRLIHWNNSVLRSGAGDVIGTASIGEDITEQKRGEIRIKRLNRVYAVLSQINALIVRVRDREELFREACRIALEHGRFRTVWIGVVDPNGTKVIPVASGGMTENFLELISRPFSQHGDALLGNTQRAIREKTAIISNDVQNDPHIVFKGEHAILGTRSMAILPLQVANEVVGILAIYSQEADFFDAEEVKLLTELAGNIAFAVDHIEKEKKLNYLAYYDVLTGLANRDLFLGRLAEYMRSADREKHTLALFVIDLERFKNINDTLGRPAGNALLLQVAEWLTRTAGDSALLARVGADQFAVVLPEVNPCGDVKQLLEKNVKRFLDHPFHLNDGKFRVAAKVGVALFPGDGADADTLFKNAEAALKKTKASGDRYLFYTQQLTEMMAGKLTLENQLRQALDKNEFVLHYQPKVNAATGKLTGAEALLRWNDPRTGLVPPARFIPILEETGLIHDVGRWVLRKAIEDYLRWCAAGLAAVRIAVNVSPLQLRHHAFVAEIRQAIGVDPHAAGALELEHAAAGLELEITESMIMDDVDHSIVTLQAIRALGVSIAIDDFGTGFSSLSYLSKLPVDSLKIDRSFVVEMTASQEGLALVSTIINLAHALKLKAVAEGVETDEQSRLLRLLNCDEMQGYLFCKPVPCDIFETKYLAPAVIPLVLTSG